MRSKPPSSLDYDGHLHELALRNWRRALAARDVPRAEINARTLTRSHDKFWRFAGWMHLGVAHLGGGRASAALDAFAEAARAYPEARELVSVAKAQSAHIHLETGSPERALEALEETLTTSETIYWRALASARLCQQEEARTLAGNIDDGLLRAHVGVELGDDPEVLREALARVAEGALASPRVVAPVAFALGVRLANENRATPSARKRGGDAAAIFRRITETPETLAHWPLPYVRALYRSGERAEFWRLWCDGDIDRAEVAEASQSTKS